MPSISTACISQSVEGHDPWILDSGASDHISSNSSLFSFISSPKVPHFVTVANGSKVVSQGIDQVPLSPSLKLNFVLFIPHCPYNLISLSQLTRSLNCLITFDANSLVIQERGTGRLIGEGHKLRGLYYLKNNPPVSCFAASEPKLLHDRLGHPSLAKLKIMVPSLKSLPVLKCESCQLEKHVRSSFPKQIEQRCNSIFSTIHLDIWGPSHVTSFGFRYFLTFIDEFSRCTWVYLMKDHSELLPIFISFFNEIRNQFGKIIKIFRSDNAKEYFSTSTELSSFLSSQGILHQSTCPHTPQQNDITERKNRHLIETARSLMLNMNVPIHHWGDAVITACFLINRMSSSSLENQIPHSIIFPNDSLFHVSPRCLVVLVLFIMSLQV
uniref:Retrovirus-related Pol polyprotein from transposon TNT 1-94 n=1 Tax=Cajanus cajan TaxID=3821 RepID=A0A151UCU3_CAJCA|nr:Retrovirus-related Pol polyprotein from transposon TNT 1-94 [Cajanus cajan]